MGSCWGEESVLGNGESGLGDEEDGDDIERRRVGLVAMITEAKGE